MTDIEECMEALAENLSKNLPHGSFMSRITDAREKDSSSCAKATTEGWDVPQSVIDTAVQELPVKLHLGGLHPSDHGAAEQRQPTQCSEATSGENEKLQRETSSARPCSGSQGNKDGEALLAEECTTSSEGCQTRVIARTLDWTGELKSFQPPFDVLLVADVVSLEQLLRLTIPYNIQYAIPLVWGEGSIILPRRGFC